MRVFRFLFAFVVVVLVPSATQAAGDLRLIDAVKSRNGAEVRALLQRRVDVNARQGDGATALHWAAYNDDVPTAQVLLGAGASPAAADDTGATPLYLACANRSAAMVRALLAGGADANARLLNGETTLMTCSRTGDVDAVKALLAGGAEVNRKEPFHDQTALMWAAAERHPAVVAALLERGAEVRARSRVYVQTVTSEVTQRAGREQLNYTVPRGGSTPLLFAARSGDEESARRLLAAGADVNDALPNGMTALVEAAHSGHQKVGMLLLEHGADPDAAAVGYTALHAAVLRGGVHLVKALLSHHANPSLQITRGTPVRRTSQDYDLPATLIGATPFLLAAKFLEIEIMDVLAAGHADTRLPLKTGETPLMVAAGVGSSLQTDRRGVAIIDGGRLDDPRRVADAVARAIALGSDVNATNQAGDTALHGAAALGYDQAIPLLVDAGARLDVRNHRGLTPLAALLATKGDTPPRASTVDLLRKLGGR